MRLLFSFLVTISLSACGGMPETAGSSLQGATAMAAPQPIGVADYCASQPAPEAQAFWNSFCQADATPTTVALTAERWNELQTVQNAVYTSTTYGPSQSWDPMMAVGDCKNYASRTAMTLLDRGYPAGAVRVATASVNDRSGQQGEMHAVVLVDTDHGTIVLDSRQATPKPWKDLSYIWLAAEVPGGHGNWSMLTTDVASLRSALYANLASRGREQIAFGQ